MKKKNLFLLLFCALCLAVPAQAKPQGSIFVDATSNLELQPDVVEFNVVITTKDEKSLESASVINKEKSIKIYNDLANMINKNNGDYIKTSSYTAEPVYHYTSGKRVFDHYEVINTITVHTKKVTEIGTFIDKSLTLGATNIGNINFKLEDQNASCNELLALAAQKTKTKAEIVAGAIGQKIVGVKELRTTCSLNSGNYPRYMNSKMSMASSFDSVAEGASTPVEGGTMKLYATVNAEYYTK